MDLNEIAVFATVVAQGSFTGAAKKLGLPKSTVSRRVSRLEDRLGVRLLQRTTRKLSLTEAGTGFYERIARALSSLEEAEHAVAEAQESPRGTLRLTAPVDFGQLYLGDVVTEFTDRYPGVVVDVELTGRTVDLVNEGFDLALRAGVLRDSSLVARKLGSTASGLFAAPSYLSERGRPTSAEELAAHDHVAFGAERQTHRWSLVDAQGVELVVPVRARVMGNEYAFIREAVLAGAGIGLIPSFLCHRDVEVGRLEQLMPEVGDQHGAGIYLVYPSARHLSAKVRAFRDFLVGFFREHSWATSIAPRGTPD